MFVATIVRRQAFELAKDFPLIGLSFPNRHDTDELLKGLLEPRCPPTRLLVVSSELFSYSPILRALQTMPCVPFCDDLLRSKTNPPEETVDLTSDSLGEEITTKISKLDATQYAALESSLRNRVGLIQRPPGTGKSFVGVLLAQILLATTNETILCVTYTNHALDDFLESLLDVDITSIVRLGGRSQSRRLAQYTLREQASPSNAPFTLDQTRRFAQLKETIRSAEKDVERLELKLRERLGNKSWSRVARFLHAHDPDQLQQLSASSRSIEEETRDDDLWIRWLRGECVPRWKTRIPRPLWRMSRGEREEQKLIWQHMMFESLRSAMTTALSTISTAQEELQQLQAAKDSRVLSQVRVVGCTTTMAAMRKNLLDDLAPGVVLVEEAAEILESHILTSLSSGTKRLIMIGDHKQLRPKCQHYPLTVESGQGHDLNCSLFERLASSGPISSLGTQHRMHPDVSAIPKLTTYPHLRDIPSVASRPPPIGLAGRVVMIDHGFEEDQARENMETLETLSRTNVHEVEIVSRTVRYLMQQGYQPNDMVVLTAYLGQMVKLQKKLREDYEVFVDDRDIAETRGHIEATESRTVDSCVRVATIDNFQGEEANIVIISLVRSNSRGAIGFLREPERVNVLFSRARDCEIIIGNQNTFVNAKGSNDPLRGGPLWKCIFEYLSASGSIYRGLPVKCQNHGAHSIVSSASDFAMLCPDGGCHKPCSKEQPCGHVCANKCHPGPCPPCGILSTAGQCKQGHPLMKPCSAIEPPPCLQRIVWNCSLGHRMEGFCSLGMTQECSSCIAIASATLGAATEVEYGESGDVTPTATPTRRAREGDNENKIGAQGQQINDNIKSILETARSLPLEAPALVKSYETQYGANLREELERCIPCGLVRTKSRKLKELLTQIPCCDIIIETTGPEGKGTRMCIGLLEEISVDEAAPKRPKLR